MLTSVIKKRIQKNHLLPFFFYDQNLSAFSSTPGLSPTHPHTSQYFCGVLGKYKDDRDWCSLQDHKIWRDFKGIIEIERKGAVHNFWKNDIAWRHNINQLKSKGSKMADKSTSARPWSLISKPNDTPRGAWTVSRHHQKPKKWVVTQFLEITTPSPK